MVDLVNGYVPALAREYGFAVTANRTVARIECQRCGSSWLCDAELAAHCNASTLLHLLNHARACEVGGAGVSHAAK